jgi:hypothetical protein
MKMEILTGSVVGLSSVSTLYLQLHTVPPKSKFHTTKGIMGPVHMIALLNLRTVG